MTKDTPFLVRSAIEFFWGETIYEMSDQLKRLRKWRFVTVTIPTVGLAMVLVCALSWPQAQTTTIQVDQAQTLGKLEFKVESIDKSVDQQRVLIERMLAEMGTRAIAAVEMKGEINAINKKLDLVGWLIGAAALAFVGQTFSYFYQLRLRRTLRGIEKRHPEEQ